MLKNIHKWLMAGTFGLLCLSAVSIANATEAPVVGKDYALLDPAIPTDNRDKIEVIEFFSYACPHCYDLEPKLHAWAAKQPTDVVVRQIPVGFNPYYQLMARLYYTLEAMGELPRLQSEAFDALHKKHLKLVDEDSIAEWAKTQGLDELLFRNTFKSFGVNAKATRGDQLAKEAKIRGVPTIIVDGRYLILGGSATSERDYHQAMLNAASLVIDKVRQEKKK